MGGTTYPGDDFRYELPAASPQANFPLWIPLLLTAVEAALDRADVWPDQDADTALGYIEDLKAVIMLLDQIPVGTIMLWAGTSIPARWLECDGTTFLISQYPALASALAPIFQGSTTFKTPDLRGRVPVGSGTGSGLTNRTLGAQGGTETHQLVQSELPSHVHAYSAVAGTPGSGVIQSGTGISVQALSSGAAGSNGAHNNMQPWIALRYIIYAG